MKRKNLTVTDYVEGVLGGDRAVLSRAITLVESTAPAHQAAAREVLERLLPHAGRSIRIGVTGVPGVGKSTLIETWGLRLCQQSHKLAVLAVDPSSSLSRGSILGDKTRMSQLSRHERAFIRPSPSGGNLGGITRRMRESIALCEAFGFDVLLVETVGVGQSETAVREVVDFFLLLMLTGGGDELQGLKKGSLELADALLITKADGDNRQRALLMQQEYRRVLHYLTPATPGWQPEVHTCSALTGEGLDALWQLIQRFETQQRASGAFDARRQQQHVSWALSLAERQLIERFYALPQIKAALPQIKAAIADGALPVNAAAERLLTLFFQQPPGQTE